MLKYKKIFLVILFLFSLVLLVLFLIITNKTSSQIWVNKDDFTNIITSINNSEAVKRKDYVDSSYFDDFEKDSSKTGSLIVSTENFSASPYDLFVWLSWRSDFFSFFDNEDTNLSDQSIDYLFWCLALNDSLTQCNLNNFDLFYDDIKTQNYFFTSEREWKIFVSSQNKHYTVYVTDKNVLFYIQ